MDKITALDCFNKYILGLWDKWEPNDFEQKIWIKTFCRFEQDDVKGAVEQYLSENKRFNKPELSKMLGCMRNRTSKKPKEKKETPKTIYFYLIDVTTGVFYRFVPQPLSEDVDFVRRIACGAKERIVESHGGIWEAHVGTPYWNMVKNECSIIIGRRNQGNNLVYNCIGSLRRFCPT